MLNVTESYGMVMKLEDRGNFVTGRLVTSEKDKRTDEWISSWWDVSFVSSAVDLAKELAEKDRIKILRGIAKVREWEAKDGSKRVTPTVVVFEFEKLEKSASTKEKREKIVEKAKHEEFVSPEDYPF